MTQDLLVSILDESVFLNESLELMIQRQINCLTAPFRHLKKQELIGGIEIFILQEVSDSWP